MLDPKVNRGKFKEDEYKRLRELVAQYGDSDWVLIAKMVRHTRCCLIQDIVVWLLLTGPLSFLYVDGFSSGTAEAARRSGTRT